MLSRLSLQGFALIDTLDLSFNQGLNLLSGDTGAGKSLLFDAMHLLAGQKSDAVWVRDGAKKADLFCELSLPDAWLALPLYQKLIDADLIDEESRQLLSLRRIINADGRSKAQVNGIPVKASLLKEVCEELFVFHDQHESIQLLKKEHQLRWLDIFAGTTELRQICEERYQSWKKLLREQQELMKAQSAAHQRRDYLLYQLQELEPLNLGERHIADLEALVRSQDHAVKWTSQADRMSQLLDDESPFLRQLHLLLQEVRQDPQPHQAMSAAVSLLDTALIHLDEARTEVQQVFEIDNLDEEQIAFSQQELDAIYRLAAKHHLPVEQLEGFLSEIKEELDALSCDTSRLEVLDQEIIDAELKVIETATKLSDQRQVAAPRLEARLTESLSMLGMKDTLWDLQVVSQGLEKINSSGWDQVAFLMSSNRGHRPQPLNKIASGGELSRISLVLHVFARPEQPSSVAQGKIYCFDEVDVGVSGQVATAIGQLLQQLAGEQQVFCISHAPQVAAQEGTHWLAEKNEDLSGQILSSWRVLDKSSRELEIARMLGTASKQEIALAKKLLKREVAEAL